MVAATAAASTTTKLILDEHTTFEFRLCRSSGEVFGLRSTKIYHAFCAGWPAMGWPDFGHPGA